MGRMETDAERIARRYPARRPLADWRQRRTVYAALQLSRIPLFIIAVAIYGWLLWHVGVLIGVFGADILPRDWSLEFMATIALMVMLVPMARTRPMLLAALAGGISAVLLRGLPLRLGLFAAIAIGIATGFAAEHWQTRGEEK